MTPAQREVRTGNAAQRIFSALWLAACIVLAAMAWDYRTEFSYEPVGPRAYPLLCLALMAAGLVGLIVRPSPLQHDEESPPATAVLVRKIGLGVILLFGYAGLFEPLGFIVSSAIAASVLAVLSGGRPVPSAMAGVAMSVALYLLFDRVLEVPLPLGVLAPLLA